MIPDRFLPIPGSFPWTDDAPVRWAIERGRTETARILAEAGRMLPFFAQRAAQALEDAVVLAGCLRESNADSVRQALQRYERLRRPRATHVQRMSRGRGQQNHLPDGPEQEARD